MTQKYVLDLFHVRPNGRRAVNAHYGSATIMVQYATISNLKCEPLNMNSKTVDAIQQLRYAVVYHAIFDGSDGDGGDSKIRWIYAANRVRQVIGTCRRQEKPEAVARPGSAVESVNSIAGLNSEILDLLRKINVNLGNFATAIEKVTAATATKGCN
ncbi:hypothetical protein ABKA04_009130 [Annulohypoxylon sp. FPYF3050]